MVKYLPYVMGGILGWLLVSPPSVFADLGPWRFLVTGALFVVLLLASVALLILMSLKEDVALAPDPSPAPLPRELEELERLGFVRAGGPLQVGVTPPALMQPLVHGTASAYATTYTTRTEPPKSALDVVSVLEGGVGGLTTGANVEATCLPGGAGGLRQAFPGASVADLVARHLEALEWLQGQDLRVKPVSATTFATDLKAGIRSQRHAFLDAPFRGTLTALYRTVTKRTPHVGRLADQEVAAAQVAELRRGGGARR